MLDRLRQWWHRATKHLECPWKLVAPPISVSELKPTPAPLVIDVPEPELLPVVVAPEPVVEPPTLEPEVVPEPPAPEPLAETPPEPEPEPFVPEEITYKIQQGPTVHAVWDEGFYWVKIAAWWFKGATEPELRAEVSKAYTILNDKYVPDQPRHVPNKNLKKIRPEPSWLAKRVCEKAGREFHHMTPELITQYEKDLVIRSALIVELGDHFD